MLLIFVQTINFSLMKNASCFTHTVRNLHFLSKNSTLIFRENCRFLRVKNSWKYCGFELFSCWQLWFHEKNCQKKIWAKNSWKCWGFVKIEFFGQKIDFSNSVWWQHSGWKWYEKWDFFVWFLTHCDGIHTLISICVNCVSLRRWW